MNDKQFTAVLTGCGSIAGSWLNALQKFDDIVITGLVDLNLESANKRKEEFKLTTAVTGTSLEDILRRVNPDMVFDCTIPDAHCQVVTATLQHGCHVLGEKPMASDMDSARKMVEAANKAGKTYAVIQNRRYLDRIVNFRDLLRGGELGALTTLNADFYLAPRFGGFREQMDHVLLLDMAIHSFDQARFISGADPVTVYCHEFNPAGSWYRHGAAAMAVFTMSDGSVFNYRGSWCAPGLPTSWQCDWRACCSNGTARWDGEEDLQAEKVSGSEGFFHPVIPVTVPDGKLQHTNHSGVIREFLDCLKSGSKPQTVCNDNFKSLAMVHAAIASAEQHAVINL
jgi:predicted dehydrogenase